jgi:hypothetical protein
VLKEMTNDEDHSDEEDLRSPRPEDVEKNSDEERTGWDEDEKLLDETTREAKKLRKESKTRIASAGKQFKVWSLYFPF